LSEHRRDFSGEPLKLVFEPEILLMRDKADSE